MAEQFEKTGGLEQVGQLEERALHSVEQDAATGACAVAGVEDAGGGASDEADEAEVPRDIKRTVIRLWHEARDQHWRFVLVIVSIILYTAFSVAAPAFSARVIDILWVSIQDAFARGRSFTVGWETGGRAIAIYLAV